MVVFFNVLETRTRLIEKGLVYTLRPKKRREGKDIAVHGSYYDHKTIGKVEIEFIREIFVPMDLLRYVDNSGFKTVVDWQTKAKGSIYLFKVMMVNQWEG